MLTDSVSSSRLPEAIGRCSGLGTWGRETGGSSSIGEAEGNEQSLEPAPYLSPHQLGEEIVALRWGSHSPALEARSVPESGNNRVHQRVEAFLLPGSGAVHLLVDLQLQCLGPPVLHLWVGGWGALLA